MEKADLSGMRLVETSTNDLVDEANAAMDKMGKDNPSRMVIFRLASALVALSDRHALVATELEQLKEGSSGKIIVTH